MSDFKRSVELYQNSNMTVSEICKVCNIPKTRFYSKYSGKKRGHLNKGRIHEFDLSKFKVMNDNLAYWLGFIAADGSVVNSSLNIHLAIKDKCLLKKFNLYFKNDNPLSEFKNTQGFDSVKATINSKELVILLNVYGIYQNKTNEVNIPYDKLGKFLPHYIRGYFDGDGTVSIRKNGQLYFSVVSGSYKMISQIKDFFGIDNKIIDYKTYYKLTVTGNIKAKKLLYKIYKDSKKENRLNRKYINYTKIGLPN